MLALLMNSMRRRRKQRAKLEKKEEVTLCCRTCLSTADLQPIFLNDGSDSKRAEELFLVTGLEIKQNDGLPQKMCTKCRSFTDEVLQFRLSSEKAHTTLLNIRPKRRKLKTKKISNEDLIQSEPNYDYNMKLEDDYVDYDDYGPSEYAEQKTSKKDGLPYKCEPCNKEFRMKNTYNAHMRSHTNYCVCELCGKKCRNNNLLLLHKRGRHGMDRIHKCAYCEYSSANKEGLVIHERRHTGEKPYICDHCGASFHRRSNLVQHIAIHLPEKNFQCEQCQKKFHSKKFLQSHKFKIHQGRKYTYVCHICHSHFTSTDSARKHLTRAHGILRENQGNVHRIPNSNLPRA